MLPVPGGVELPDSEWVVEARTFNTGIEAVQALGNNPDSLWYALFELDKLTLPLVVRSYRPGDRMCWRGLKGSKKLQDLFTDEKVPAARRRSVPLVVEDGGNGRILVVAELRNDADALTIEECRASKSKTVLLTVTGSAM
jgi:tRNA(Ile)-lysidine synthase